MIVPGVVGAVGLIFALISLDKLEVVWGGLLFILLGMAFMIAEAFIPSFGMLGVGGVISFVVGSLFLFDEAKTGYSVSTSVVVSTSVILGAVTLGLSYLALSSRNVKKLGMYNDVLGEEVQVTSLDAKDRKKGQVRVNGELWTVQSKSPLTLDDKVKIVGYKGLTLHVDSIITKEQENV
jgi:membrane-bound serine protease (ClpP class)